MEIILTDADIISRARLISDASAEITKIEEEKKRIPGLRNTIKYHSEEIAEGKIKKTFLGEHSWHDPIEGKVTITPVEDDKFRSFVRDMTDQEMSEHSQIELEFQDNPVKTAQEEINDAVADHVYMKDLEERAEAKISDSVPVFRSEKDGSYFLLDPDGGRIPLTIYRETNNVLTFIDPNDPLEGLIIKFSNDIHLLDKVEEPQEYDPNKIDVYKSVKSERFFIYNDVEERVYLEVVSSSMSGSNLIVFKDPAVSNGYIRKLQDSIILVDQKKGGEHLLNSVNLKLKTEEAA